MSPAPPASIPRAGHPQPGPRRALAGSRAAAGSRGWAAAGRDGGVGNGCRGQINLARFVPRLLSRPTDSRPAAAAAQQASAPSRPPQAGAARCQARPGGLPPPLAPPSPRPGRCPNQWEEDGGAHPPQPAGNRPDPAREAGGVGGYSRGQLRGRRGPLGPAAERRWGKGERALPGAGPPPAGGCIRGRVGAGA